MDTVSWTNELTSSATTLTADQVWSHRIGFDSSLRCCLTALCRMPSDQIVSAGDQLVDLAALLPRARRRRLVYCLLRRLCSGSSSPSSIALCCSLWSLLENECKAVRTRCLLRCSVLLEHVVLCAFIVHVETQAQENLQPQIAHIATSVGQKVNYATHKTSLAFCRRKSAGSDRQRCIHSWSSLAALMSSCQTLSCRVARQLTALWLRSRRQPAVARLSHQLIASCQLPAVSNMSLVAVVCGLRLGQTEAAVELLERLCVERVVNECDVLWLLVAMTTRYSRALLHSAALPQCRQLRRILRQDAGSICLL